MSVIEISTQDSLPPEPAVSVCMVTYRHERFIAEAIEGVINQRVDFPIELVIGEDCSGDETGTIVRDYQSRYPQLIRIISSDSNVGMRANSLRSVNACRGKFIAVCDGDDFWQDPNKLKKQRAVLDANPSVSLVCHSANVVDCATGDILFVQRAAGVSRLLSTTELILGDGALIPTVSICMRANIAKPLPAWVTESPAMDYPLVLHASLCGRVAHIDETMSTYRVNTPGPWTRSLSNETLGRYVIASGFATMLRGFSEAERTQGRTVHVGEVREAISKHLFGAIVKTAGSQAEKAALFKNEKTNLVLLDRLATRLSLAIGANLGWTRTLPRMVLARARTRVFDLLEPRYSL